MAQFNLSIWPKFSRDLSFKFVWVVHGAASWYREAADGIFELYDVEGRCAPPGTLRSIRSMLKEKGKIPDCPNRKTSCQIHSGHTNLNQRHIDY